MSEDMITWLRVQLDEDERVARAATPGPWWHNPGKMWLAGEAFERFDRGAGEEFVGFGGPSPFTGCVAATGPADHTQSMADAAHIARHDPVRVLAEVAAKRRILDEHDPDWPRLECPTCCGYDGNDNYGVERRPREAYPCRVVRLLAVPLADRPGYRDEWRP